MKYRPIGDNVLVEMDAMSEHWDAAGLLARPDTGLEMPVWGTVAATPRGRVGVSPGDRVVVPWSTGVEIAIGGTSYRSVRDRDILAVAE